MGRLSGNITDIVTRMTTIICFHRGAMGIHGRTMGFNGAAMTQPPPAWQSSMTLSWQCYGCLSWQCYGSPWQHSVRFSWHMRRHCRGTATVMLLFCTAMGRGCIILPLVVTFIYHLLWTFMPVDTMKRRDAATWLIP